MLLLTRFLRRGVIALGLVSLAFVLFPKYTEPLWAWANTIATGVGNEPLPSFGQAQHWSSLSLAGFVIAGIAYNLWRDRRYRIMQAEYDWRTGATHLKEKVAELQARLRRTAQDRNKWEEAYLALNKQHAAALVTSKEHEIRSEFGSADRETLGALRKEFDGLVQARGHIEGFREAMRFFLENLSQPDNPPAVTVETKSNGSSKDRTNKETRAALPFHSATRS